jgi:pyrroloquinoline quinone (PQQ) biosynthesis protein C
MEYVIVTPVPFGTYPNHRRRREACPCSNPKQPYKHKEKTDFLQLIQRTIIMNLLNVLKVRLANRRALKRIRSHRFVRTAYSEQSTQEQVERMLYLMGRESKTFPGILEGMLIHANNPTVERIISENLDDEYGNADEAHYQHYLQLLRQIDRLKEFDDYHERAGIKLALELAANMAAERNAAIAIGYLLVNEGMTPITYGALEKVIYHYFPGLKTKFFTLHVRVDKHHVAELFRAIKAMRSSVVKDILYGMALGERGIGVLLDEADGVYDSVDLEQQAA